jgi:hypothetical protein
MTQKQKKGFAGKTRKAFNHLGAEKKEEHLPYSFCYYLVCSYHESGSYSKTAFQW